MRPRVKATHLIYLLQLVFPGDCSANPLACRAACLVLKKNDYSQLILGRLTIIVKKIHVPDSYFLYDQCAVVSVFIIKRPNELGTKSLAATKFY